jgi:hypothetical protein
VTALVAQRFSAAQPRFCYPLTITDYVSQCLIACKALSTRKERYAFGVFERVWVALSASVWGDWRSEQSEPEPIDAASVVDRLMLLDAIVAP